MATNWWETGSTLVEEEPTPTAPVAQEDNWWEAQSTPVREPDPVKDYEVSSRFVSTLTQAKDENYGRYEELAKIPERTPEVVAEMVKSFNAGKEAEIGLYREQEILGKLQTQIAEQEKRRQIEEAKKAREQAAQQVAATPIAAEATKPSDWDTLRGLEVSMRQMPQLAYGVTGLIGATAEELTGYGEALRDWGFRGYKDWEQSIEPISKETDSVTVAWNKAKEGDVGALVDWAQYGIGYALGQLGETAAVALLGGLAGGAAAVPAGPVAVPAAAGGAVLAAAGKTGFKELATNLVEKAIAKQALKIVKEQATKQGIKLTAEQLAKQAETQAVKKLAGKEIGSNAAIFANSIGMELGSIYGEAESQARAEGRELTGVELSKIWGSGLAAGGLEGVTDKLGLDLLKGKFAAKLPAGRLAGAAVAGGVGVLGEGLTETAQTVIERFGAGKEVVSDDAVNEYINAASLGALGGGVIGGAGGFIAGNPKENAAAKAKVAAEASKNVAPATANEVAKQADAVINEVVQETPDQRVARLQQEAKAAAGITLEEEAPVAGLPPTPEVAQTAKARITEREGKAATPVETPAGTRIEAAAYQAPDGTVYYGASHLDAMAKARDAGKIDQAAIDAKQETTSRETPEFGFSTDKEPFIGRSQAEVVATGSGQMLVDKPATGLLHSNEVSLDAFAQPAKPAQPITATRTVADAIRDKDTFIYNDQRGAVSVEDGVTVFRPFGTQDKFEIGINPNQKIGEIEGIEWARKGQVRTTPIESKPEIATIVESNPVITTDEIDQAEPDFEVPAALVEIQKSKTLNDLADLFDTGESKVSQEGKRATKVSQTPEFYRQATPQQIGLARRLIDNALRIIDAMPVSDQQKQDMAEPYLLLDQDITNYENNPNYQRYKASIRTEVRPTGKTGVLPETETEVAAAISELEQRAKAEAERLERAKRVTPVIPPVTPEAPTLEDINPAQLAAQKETPFGKVDPQTQVVDATGRIVPRYMWHSPPSGLKQDQGVVAYVSREEGAQRAIDESFGGKNVKTVWLGRFGRDKGMRQGAFTIDLAKLDPANIMHTGQAEGNVWYRGDIPESAINRSGIDPTPKAEPQIPQKAQPLVNALKKQLGSGVKIKIVDTLKGLERSAAVVTLDNDGNVNVTVILSGIDALVESSKNPEALQKAIEKIADEEADHVSAIKTIGYEGVLAAARRLSPAEREAVAKLYISRSNFATDAEYNNAVKEFAATKDGMTQEQIDSALQLIGFEHLRQVGQRVRSGQTTEDIFNAKTANPSVIKSVLQYLAKLASQIQAKLKVKFDANLQADLNRIEEYRKILQAVTKPETPVAPTFTKGEMVRIKFRVPTYEGGKVVGGRDELVAGSVTRIMPDGKIEVRMQRGGYQTLAPNEVQKIERPSPAAPEARREPAITPQQDRDYLDAVERGDLDAASKMVEDAAAATSGINTTKKLYRSESIDVKDTGGAIFFTEDIGYTSYYEGEGRMLRTAYMPSNILDPRKNNQATLIRGWIEEKIKSLEERYYNGEDVKPVPLADAKRFLERGGAPSLASAWANLYLADRNQFQAVGSVEKAIMSDLGFDAMYVPEFGRNRGEEVSVAFRDASAIKSADPVTYDDQGNIIPLSQRFQPEQADIRYSYAGVRAQTPQFMRDSLSVAQAMAAKGEDAEAIRSVTGWIVNPYDGKLRWEIPDNDAKFVSSSVFANAANAIAGGDTMEQFVGKLGDILDHKPLFDAYPDLKNVEIFMANLVGTDAEFRKGSNIIPSAIVVSYRANPSGVKSLILHEIQHWIQNEENFAKGGNLYNLITPEYLSKARAFKNAIRGLSDAKDKILRATEAIAQEKRKKSTLGFGGPSKKEIEYLEGKISDATQLIEKIWENQTKIGIPRGSSKAALLRAINDVENKLGTGWNLRPSSRADGLIMIYERLAGEIEARDVQARMELTAEQRRAVQPYSSENISPEDAIVMEQVGVAALRGRRVQMGRAGMETSAVEARLQELGFPTGGIIRVVNQPDADFEGRTIILDGKVTGIELNASALKDNAAIDRVLNHEFAESANADGALNRLVERLTPKEKKEINDTITRLRYEERARTAEEAARAIETLAEAWKGRGFFTRAVARVEAWASKLGFKLTRRAAEYIAARNLAEVNDNVRKWNIGEAMANIKGARRVNVGGLQAILIPPSEMRLAYSIAAYHGTPHEIKGGFQLAKIGTGEGATSYGWGLYFAENIDVARSYLAQFQRQFSPSNQVSRWVDEAINSKHRIELLESMAEDLRDYVSEKEMVAVRAFVEYVKKSGYPESVSEVPIGNIYNVTLDVDQSELLDWDQPVNEEIARKIYELTNGSVSPIPFQMGEDGRPIFVSGRRLTGGETYKLLGVALDKRTPTQIAIQGAEPQKRIASEALLSIGIKGIRYLDAGSRPRLESFKEKKRISEKMANSDAEELRRLGYQNVRVEQDEDGNWVAKADLSDTRNYVIFDENVINITARNGQPVDIRESRREPEAIPTFTEGTPEAATLKEMATSMAKVDAASEAKGGKPETYKISEIASIWMDSGLGERELQDAIVEYTNLTPANAQKVAKAIAKQYDIQQSIATAFLETQTGLSVEALPEGVTLPKEVDPDRPRPVMQRLFEVFMGVKVPPKKITGSEKAFLRSQILLKIAANRAAKNAQKATADAVVETIKSMGLYGEVRPKQVAALAKRAAKVIWTSEKSVEVFNDYAAKVVANANYDADLREAKDAQKRAKQLSKQKNVAMSPQRQVLDNISRVAVNRLDDPRMFADVVNYYMRAFKSAVSPDYVVMPDSELTSYLSQMESEATTNQTEIDRVANERLAAKYGVSVDEVNKLVEADNIIAELKKIEKREEMENLLTEKAIETQLGLSGYDTSLLRADQKPLVEALLKVDPSKLDAKEKQKLIRIANNVIYNDQTNGAQVFVAIANGQQNARQAAQDSAMVKKNRAWIDILPTLGSKTAEKTFRNWALELQSVADTFRNIFGKESMAKMFRLMGLYDLDRGFTDSNNVLDKIQEAMAEFYKKNVKKYGKAARDQDGILSEGIVGFLIQRVPAKGESESIAQRRDLIKQDIANRRDSQESDRIAMADRIEKILNEIDGNTIEEILNNLKQKYRPNYDSVMYLMNDLLPQYKEFLQRFDENFNDQANNYDNPYYLPIDFVNAGPTLEITPESEALFYENVSLRPKQAANTIKRVDYTKLPLDKSDKPKEIQFNLRKGTYDSLSEQINAAYTSEAWQKIFSFMKTPEAQVALGGGANRDFMVERLNRLRISRMRRGSMNNGAMAKLADSLSTISRKLGVGIALGGVYQVFKQSPDQLISAIGTTGRPDLLSESITTIGKAKAILNKFSIGRRGDASAGYKYINQMEGAQNRLERAFTESRWSEVKESASKIADVWMIALKKTDFACAAAAWMTYYRADLDKKGIKFEGWDKEAQLVDTDPARQDAASYAENMTDIYQGSSDPTKMATFAQSGKSGWENLFKAIFVPFNSFAVQQRMRIYSDARDAFTQSGEAKKAGAAGLTATVGGMLMFHTVRRLWLPVLTGAGATALYALLGVDMDEPDEEKQKEEANKRWRQFQGEVIANMLVGGAPQFVEAQLIDAINYSNYLVSLQLESDDIIDDKGEIMSFDKYQKERSPLWRYRSFDNAMTLGMLDIGFGQAEKAITQTKMLATPEEMEKYTPEEQRLLWFSALSEWMYLMRLNDADFARMVTKARKDMVSAVKDREKNIKAIREGR